MRSKLSKLAKAVRHPRWAFEVVWEIGYQKRKFRRLQERSFKRFLSKVTSQSMDDYRMTVQEILGLGELNSFVNEQYKSAGLPDRFPQPKYEWPTFLYYFIRKTSPKVIVETGCFYGNSTAYILAALLKNEGGKLYTIDLPAYPESGGYYDENPYLDETERRASLPRGREPGFIIPDFLKSNWKLILGTSKDELPRLMTKWDSVDMFLHDSLHSHENMIFEYSLAISHLKRGGFIFSDNIDWNSAFVDFCKRLNKPFYTYLAYYESPVLKHNFGAILNA